MNETTQYLGDSVYADFDGYYIWLTTENGYPDDPRNKIALEPCVFEALKQYVEWLKEQFNRPREEVEEEA